ncbi:MAG: Rap1a/Tai family immunity protein [Gammaproteobacteria bacterium]|nr:Rap1a/Tai family immunity protein [Gammaproteobacteria bacterium]
MKTHTLILILMLAIPIQASLSAGNYFNGIDMYAFATSDDPVKEALFMGYVSGVLDANTEILCVPAEVTLQQAAGITMKYLEQHPDIRHYAGRGFVILSITEAFPCGNK